MFQITSYTDIGGRERNEDTVRSKLLGDKLCLVVADGLGGHGGGEQASFAAAETICDGWNGETDSETLKHLFSEANQKVLSLQTRQCAMKTTAVALILTPGQAVWAHLGDSRLYHFLDGKLVFQTRDHSVAQIGVMLGEITLEQIRFHEDRSRVLRAIGQDGEPNVEIGGHELTAGRHAFLLCSDGFWEYVLEEEMEADLKDAADPENWLSLMRSRLAARIPSDNDNNTAAVVWVEERSFNKNI